VENVKSLGILVVCSMRDSSDSSDCILFVGMALGWTQNEVSV